MAKNIEYTVIVHEAEEGGYWTEVPGLAGAGSQRETLGKAIENTKESIRAGIDVMREEGKEVAVPNDIVLKVTVPA